MCFFVWLDVKFNKRPTSVEKLTEDIHVVFWPTPSYRRGRALRTSVVLTQVVPYQLHSQWYRHQYGAWRQRWLCTLWKLLIRWNILSNPNRHMPLFLVVSGYLGRCVPVPTWPFLTDLTPVLLVRDFFPSCGLSELLPILHLPFFGLVDWLFTNL